MAKKDKMLEQIDRFYAVILEEYSEVTRRIKIDNSPTKILKKKNYDKTIEWIRKCKTTALNLDPMAVMNDNPDTKVQNLGNAFMKVLATFNALCDAQIKTQTYFKDKAEGKRPKYSYGKSCMREVNHNTKNMQDAMRNLDIFYADYVEREVPDDDDDDFGGDSEFKTYDQL